MGDIISQGSDRDPGPWRRRAIVAGVLAVAGAALIVTRLPHHPPARPSPGPTLAVAGPDGITGRSAAWNAGLRLPLAAGQPALLSPGTGHRALIGGLPLSRAGYAFTPVGGGWAIQPAAGPGAAPRAVCDTCAGLPEPVWFLPAHGRQAVRLPLADAVAPAAASGAVWLTTYPPGASLQMAAGTAREVGVSGAQPGPAVRLPAGYAIVQGTAAGLLLAPVSQGATAVDVLWDPAGHRVASMLPAVLAAGPAQVAQAPPCGGGQPCQVRILSLATRRVVTITLPAGSTAASAAFSPDGAFLALQVSSGAGGGAGDSGGLATRLEVAATGTGRLALVPRISLSSDALVGFGWPPGGDTLVAELSFTTRVQLAAWVPGAPGLAVAALPPGRGPGEVVVG
jgi:hypothetical protein